MHFILHDCQTFLGSQPVRPSEESPKHFMHLLHLLVDEVSLKFASDVSKKAPVSDGLIDPIIPDHYDRAFRRKRTQRFHFFRFGLNSRLRSAFVRQSSIRAL